MPPRGASGMIILLKALWPNIIEHIIENRRPISDADDLGRDVETGPAAFGPQPTRQLVWCWFGSAGVMIIEPGWFDHRRPNAQSHVPTARSGFG
jgi:hypothetical protein